MKKFSILILLATIGCTTINEVPVERGSGGQSSGTGGKETSGGSGDSSGKSSGGDVSFGGESSGGVAGSNEGGNFNSGGNNSAGVGGVETGGTAGTAGSGAAGEAGTGGIPNNCIPKTCLTLEVESGHDLCDVHEDGCGNWIQCGGCESGDICGKAPPYSGTWEDQTGICNSACSDTIPPNNTGDPILICKFYDPAHSKSALYCHDGYVPNGNCVFVRDANNLDFWCCA